MARKEIVTFRYSNASKDWEVRVDYASGAGYAYELTGPSGSSDLNSVNQLKRTKVTLLVDTGDLAAFQTAIDRGRYDLTKTSAWFNTNQTLATLLA